MIIHKKGVLTLRKYFPSLFGNDALKVRIGRAIELGTAPHAFLIDGPLGSGKTTLAIEISAAKNCERINSPDYPLPCGECRSCKRIYSGNFPDLKILERPSDRATIGVEAVKLFREDMFLSSTESDCKIYIIKNADTMTSEAQNALLKVLEEPPSGVNIILLAESCDKILTTVKSRAQYISMMRFTEKETLSYLLSESEEARKMHKESPERLLGIIMSSDGRLGLAKKLIQKKFSEENDEQRKETLDFILAISAKASFSDIRSAIFSLPQKRQELLASLERICCALRDLIVTKESLAAPTVFYPTPDEAIRAGADISLKRLLTVFDAVNEAHALCSKNANVSSVSTNLLSKIKLGISR